MNRFPIIFLFGIALLAADRVCAQAPTDMVPVMIQGTDTIPMYMLAPVEVEAVMSRRARRNATRTDRLTRYVQKVYPYALITAKLLDEYDHDLATIQRESDKDLYLKLAEAELKAEFEQDIKGMTIIQGRILVKLIDRQTGHTSYDLVKQLRGSFEAWMWQGVAKLFGNDLKGRECWLLDLQPQAWLFSWLAHNSLTCTVSTRASICPAVVVIENGELATTPRAPRTEKATARLVKRKARLYRKYGVSMPVVSAN